MPSAATLTSAEAECLDDDAFVAAAPPPRVADPSHAPNISNTALDHAEHMALAYRRNVNEGASFVKHASPFELPLEFDLITVVGGQYLHHDRHMAGRMLPHGAMEHTWNYVVSSDEDQMLLVEVAEGIFEHIHMPAGAFFYFNTTNRHLVSRSNPDALVVLAQISGYGPTEGDLAGQRLREMIEGL